MRNLATIQQIESIMPIPGKDRIALARVLGWQVIIQKSQFKEGDLCIYCEIDSVMPDIPSFEFLRSKNFRIRTMKMAGVVSQGICFPLSILQEVNINTPDLSSFKIGDDVTKLLRIKQYAPTMDDDKYTGNPKKSESKLHKKLMRYAWFRKINKIVRKPEHSEFPFQISKTDEIRIQNAPEMLEDKSPYVLTEKIDGSSGSFLLVKHKFLFFTRYQYIVCSRNIRLPVCDNSVYWEVSKKYNIKKALIRLINSPFFKGAKWLAIQGECISPKIQKNKYQVAEPCFYAFNLIAPKDGRFAINRRVGSTVAKQILEKENIPFVPIITASFILPDTVDEMLSIAHGLSQINEETLREGLVVRSLDGAKSFKAVDPEFLIKWEE